MPVQATTVRYRVLAWLCLAASIAYICRNSLAVAESTIRRDLGLSEKQMGAVMSAFFLTYALGQIPTGWLGYRWGSRRILPVLSIVWSGGTAAMALATGTWLLISARLVNGLGQAGLFPCSTQTIATWIPGKSRALATGLLAASMNLGGAVGMALTGSLLEGGVAWEWIFVGLGSLGIVWAVGFGVCFRDDPREHAAANEAERTLIGVKEAPGGPAVERAAPEATPWTAMLTSPALWCICLQQFFRAAAMIFFASWFPTYLQQARGITVGKSGQLNVAPLIALVLGALLGGIVSDRIMAKTGSRRLARKGLACASLIACAALVFLAFSLQNVFLVVGVISAGTFFGSFAGPCAYTITIDMGGRHVATVFGAMNMSGNVGAVLFPLVVPYVKAAVGWEGVMLLFGSLFVAAAISWMLLKPDGTIFDQSLVRRDGGQR